MSGRTGRRARLAALLTLLAARGLARTWGCGGRPKPPPSADVLVRQADGQLVPESVYLSRASHRSFRFVYTVIVHNLPRRAERVEIWIPLPPLRTPDQVSRDLLFSISQAKDYLVSVHEDPVYGNRILHLQAFRPETSRVDITLYFDVLRRRRDVGGLTGFPVRELAPKEQERLRAFLVPDRRLGPTARWLAANVPSLARPDAPPAEQATAIYRYVRAELERRSQSGWEGRPVDPQSGIGRANPHEIFVALCQAKGLPARLEYGFVLPPGQKSGHLAGPSRWAAFYYPGVGWLPVDFSPWMNRREPARPVPAPGAVELSGLPPGRVLFSVGRELTLAPAAARPGEPLPYFVLPHVEVDARPFDGVATSFYFQEEAVWVRPSPETPTGRPVRPLLTPGASEPSAGLPSPSPARPVPTAELFPSPTPPPALETPEAPEETPERPEFTPPPFSPTPETWLPPVLPTATPTPTTRAPATPQPTPTTGGDLLLPPIIFETPTGLATPPPPPSP